MERRIYVLFCTLVLLSALAAHTQVLSQLEEQGAMGKASKRLIALVSSGFQGTDSFDAGTQYIFPFMNFTCEGHITKLLIGAVNDTRRRQNQFLDLEFRIWKEGINNTLSVVASSTIGIGNTNNSQVYELVPNRPLEASEGCVFGFIQPQRSVLVLGEITSNERPIYELSDQAITVSLESLTESQSMLLPLIAIQIENEEGTVLECSNGFIEEERVRLVASVTTLRQRTQALFPLMVFMHNGAITQVEIAQSCCSKNPVNPTQLQIWRESTNSSNTYEKQGCVNVSVNEAIDIPFLISNISIDPPLDFKENDVVGLYVPTSTPVRPYYYYEANTTGVGYTVRTVESLDEFVADEDVEILQNALPLMSLTVNEVNNGTPTHIVTAVVVIVAFFVITFIVVLVLFAKSRQLRNRKKDQNCPTIRFATDETDSNPVESTNEAKNQEYPKTIETEENVAYNTTHLQRLVFDDDDTETSSDGEYTHVTPARRTGFLPSSPEAYLQPYHTPNEPQRTLSSLPLVGSEEQCDGAQGEMEPTYDSPVPALHESHVYAAPTGISSNYQNTQTEDRIYENATGDVQELDQRTYCNTSTTTLV